MAGLWFFGEYTTQYIIYIGGSEESEESSHI